VTTAYRKQLSETVSRLRRKYGFASREDRKRPEKVAAKDKSGECGGPASRKRFAPMAEMPLLEPQMRLF
jgi:hypothetical protein